MDYALLAMSTSSFAAASREGYYVAGSRASEELQIFTDDKTELRDYAIQKSSERMAAMELIRSLWVKTLCNCDRNDDFNGVVRSRFVTQEGAT